MKKKGVFFTFLALLFASIFVMIALSETNPLKSKPFEITSSVGATKDYVDSLEGNYLITLVKFSAIRATRTIICEENRTQRFFTPSIFQENMFSLMKTGFFSNWFAGPITECNLRYMTNHTLDFTIEVMENLSKEYLDIDSDINVFGLKITQTDPWDINIFVNTSLKIESSSANWYRNTTIKATFPIEGFDDPTYMLGSSGTLRRKINPVKKKLWAIITNAQFIEHIENETYYEDPYAPSFLLRLQNDTFASDCCGIVSIVNPNKISLPIDPDQSYVDFYYFNKIYENCNGNLDLYNITGLTGSYPLYPNFKLDFSHLFYYNLSDDGELDC